MDWILKFLSFVPAVLLAILGAVSFLIPPTWSLQDKLLLYFIIVSASYFFYGLWLQYKLAFFSRKNKDLNDEITSLNGKAPTLQAKIDARDDFIHKRKIFVTHDLKSLHSLLIDYETHVIREYPNRKFKELRDEAAVVRRKGTEIIFKEERDFDEQYPRVKSD